MGTFPRLFHREPKQDHLYDKLRTLVSSAHILAVSSLKKFMERHPKLSNINPDDWDFFVTVAAITYALMGLANNVPKKSKYTQLSKIIAQDMRRWNQDAEYTGADLMKTLQKARMNGQHLSNEEATKLLAICLGSWCMVNFNLSLPREEPDPLATELGMIIIHSFADWWKTKIV